LSRLGQMAPRSLLALALAAAVPALAACGGEDAKLLPGGTAREITANLDTVQQLSDEGDCVGAESAAQQVGEQIEALQEVDPKLKRALEEGAARLEEVIARCEESTTEAIAPATIPAEPEEEEEGPDKEKKKEQKEKERDGEDGEAQPNDDEAPETPSGSPELPPQAEGEGKGLEDGDTPPPGEEEGESPSGGVSPGSPAAEGE
jgi:hypothetical protein